MIHPIILIVAALLALPYALAQTGGSTATPPTALNQTTPPTIGGSGLPAPGTVIPLTPTPTGYEAQITVDPAKHYTAVDASSTEAGLARSLAAKPVTNADGSIRRLTLTVATGALRQGPHPVTLTATAGTTATAPVDVSLQVPEVKLDPPDTLVVTRTEQWPFGPAVQSTNPQLWPIDRNAWLTGIVIQQRGNTDASGPVAGRIVAGPDPLPPEPPKSDIRIALDKQIKLQGDFPLGTAKGKLVIEADQLAQAVPLPFEIRSHVTLFYLALVIFTGLLFGFGTRIYLQKVLALGQERQKGFTLIDVIRAAEENNTDTVFREAAEQARKDAEAEVRAADVTTVQNGVQAAQQAFQAALGALTARRTALNQKIAAMRAIMLTEWRVPPQLEHALQEQRAWLQQGPSALARNDVGTADSEVDLQRIAFARDAAVVAASLGRQATTLITGLPHAAPLLGGSDSVAAMTQHVQDRLQPLLTALQQMEDDPNAAQAAVQSLLNAVHQLCTHMGDALATAQEAMTRQVQHWSDRLEPDVLVHPDAWIQWRTEASTIRLIPAGNDFAAAVMAAEGLAPLMARLQAALAQQLDNPAEVKAACAAGDYEHAVALVIAARRAATKAAAPLPTVEGRVMGGEAPAAGDGVATPIPAPVPLRQTIALLLGTQVAVAAAPEPVQLDMLAALTRRTTATAGLLLWLVNAAVIAIAGFFIFADKWVGTPYDWAVAFFWAWGTNVGADAAIEAAKGLRRS